MPKSFLLAASTIVLLTTVLIGCGTYGNNMAPATQAARFAYVANSSDNSISIFSMDSTSGQLSKIGQTPSGGVHPIFIKTDPTGKFLYVAHSASGNVSTFAIDRNSGSLTTIGSPAAAGSGSRSMTMDSKGKFLYVANETSGDVSAFALDLASGTPSASGAAQKAD